MNKNCSVEGALIGDLEVMSLNSGFFCLRHLPRQWRTPLANRTLFVSKAFVGILQPNKFGEEF